MFKRCTKAFIEKEVTVNEDFLENDTENIDVEPKSKIANTEIMNNSEELIQNRF